MMTNWRWTSVGPGEEAYEISRIEIMPQGIVIWIEGAKDGDFCLAPCPFHSLALGWDDGQLALSWGSFYGLYPPAPPDGLTSWEIDELPGDEAQAYYNERERLWDQVYAEAKAKRTELTAAIETWARKEVGG